MSIAAFDPARRALLEAGLLRSGLDGLLASLPSEVLLLTGYWPIVGTAIALVTRDGRVALLAPEDERGLAEAAAVDHLELVRPGSLDESSSPIKDLRAPLRRLFGALGVKAPGIVGHS